MKNYLKRPRNQTINYFTFNNHNYYINDRGTAYYLTLTPDPEREILEAGATVGTIGDSLKNLLIETAKAAKTATERAEYLATIGERKNKTRIFTDESGEIYAFDNKLFSDFEKKPDKYTLFNYSGLTTRDLKVIAAFKNNVFLGIILPIRLADPAATLEAAKEAKAAEEAQKAQKAAEKAAKARAFAACIA